MIKIHSSEITRGARLPLRRQFLQGMGLVAGHALLTACGARTSPRPAGDSALPTSIATDELGNALTPFDDVTGYKHFYEFTLRKEGVARLTKDFVTEP
jgi:DMSO/TMAO reductase YedYZ molybdopterin-dependent catalytic subunit